MEFTRSSFRVVSVTPGSRYKHLPHKKLGAASSYNLYWYRHSFVRLLYVPSYRLPSFLVWNTRRKNLEQASISFNITLQWMTIIPFSVFTAHYSELPRPSTLCGLRSQQSDINTWKTKMNLNSIYTGRFIMFSGITKIYNRKTVGHVFTKPVRIEGTTQNFFSQ